MWFLLKGTVSEIEFVSDKLIGIQKILLDHGLQRVCIFFLLPMRAAPAQEAPHT